LPPVRDKRGTIFDRKVTASSAIPKDEGLLASAIKDVTNMAILCSDGVLELGRRWLRAL